MVHPEIPHPRSIMCIKGPVVIVVPMQMSMVVVTSMVLLSNVKRVCFFKIKLNL